MRKSSSPVRKITKRFFLNRQFLQKMEGFLRLTLFVSFFCILKVHLVSPEVSCGRGETNCSHLADFWRSWPASSAEDLHHSGSLLTQTCNEAFSRNFPTPLKIQQCNFTSRFLNVSPKTPKECSDECLVLLKMFIVEIIDLEFCYKDQFKKLPKDCENYLESKQNLKEISECHFSASKDILEFKLPNSNSHVCLAECITDIGSLLLKFNWKKTCYADWRNVNRAIANIKSGNLSAAGVFKLKIPKAAHFQIIIDELHNDYFVNLASFIEQMESASYRHQFLHTLYKTIKSESDLRKNNVIILKKMVDDEIHHRCNPSNSSDCISLQKIKTDVDTNAEDVITDWASEVRRNNFDEIVEFGSPQKLSPAGYAFQQVLSKLIDKTMDGNIANLNPTYAFVKKLRWNMHKYEALSKLKTWLSHAEDRFMLLIAVGIKETLEHLEGPDPKLEVKTGLETLRNSYPQNVRDVVWNGDCRIRNDFYSGSYNEYLFVGEEKYHFKNTNMKRVFTWVQPEIPLESMWRFGKVEKDGEIRFLIRNVDSGRNLCPYVDFRVPYTIFGKFLYEKETVLESDRRYVCLGDDRCNWYVEFDKTPNGIYLKNVRKGEYLFASEYKYPTDSDSRYPLLWKPGVKVDGSLWNLECNH